MKEKASQAMLFEEEFDEKKAGDRLCDWLRDELSKWPEESLRVAKHWIRQIIEKEF